MIPSRIQKIVNTFVVAVVIVAAPTAARADEPGWRWLRSKNRHVEHGNEKMAAGDEKAALEHYDAAARELPSEGGVHLNRGLALLGSGDLAGAREAFRQALEPPASAAVRADAHYDLGIDFYRDADALAGKESHDEAQKLFREAADAFRQALRLRPSDRNAAWNLELAARRVREQEEKQKQEEQEQQKNEQQDEQQKGQDEQKQQEPEQQKDQPKPQDQQGKPGEQDKQREQDQKTDATTRQSGQEEPKRSAGREAREGQPAPQALPSDVTQALDALQDSEENLERVKARMRSQRERRTPEKDW